MATDYTKMWEAWVSGTGWDSPLGQGTSPDQQRIIDFYNEIVGPSWGGVYTEGEEGFGDIYKQYIGTGAGTEEGWTTKEMEFAEREFKMSIGDPYTYGTDPFSWERVSRMTPNQAQIQLEAELFGQGKRLGGGTGAEYGTGMSKELETYTTGLSGESKALTHGALTSGVSLASGTSGAVIRSGEGITASEDILIESYKKAKSLGSGYRAGKAGIELDLESDLNKALGDYIDAIDLEKSNWYDIIKDDVLRAQTPGMDMGYEFGEVSTEDWGEEYTAGLEYTDGGGVWADEACGIGKVRNSDGECVVAAGLGLEEDKYGYLCPSGNVDDCGVCDGDNVCVDECGVPDGDGSSCVDCAGVPNGGTETDECGVCGGDGGDVVCDNGSTVCIIEQCPETASPTCPPGDPTCDPTGDIICNEGYEWDAAINDCVQIYEPPGDYDVLCHEGMPYESWTTGSSPTDYSNCPVYPDEDTCDDGSPVPPQGCPEDQTEDCNCVASTTWDDKASEWVTLWIWDCPGQPQDGEICSSGDDGGTQDYTGWGAF